MQEALKAYGTSQSDLYAANQLVSEYINTTEELENKLKTKSERVKRLMDNAKIISEDFDELEKEKEQLEFENNQLREFQSKFLGLSK